jgi:succinate-semialdehyde dehydrogenase / glutarate-semialdehyde dehydrogenase
MTQVLLCIDGTWREGRGRKSLPIENPATGIALGSVAVAGTEDLEEAAQASVRGFNRWRSLPPFDRAKILQKAAALLRERTPAIAAALSAEQGKPINQAVAEVGGSADVIEWFAEEGKRCFGQVIPGRAAGAHVLTRLEPVGPVAAFSPWNFPVSQAVKKIAAALGAGCSIILKGPEETPAACADLVGAFIDAGVPAGTVQLLFGVPEQISEYLIAHPATRKVTFTGSVAVGKKLASLAGQHMKRVTMELGGHAPVIVCDDADVARAATELVKMKYLNAGQVCLSPTRFLIHRRVYPEFLDKFVDLARSIKVDAGSGQGVEMGPLASARRVQVMESFVADAVRSGAKLGIGGVKLDRPGHFFSPTVLHEVPTTARAMNEEPFGPLALLRPFEDIEEALAEANRLPYGLASYVFTRSIRNEAILTEGIEAGMIAVNRIFSSAIEAPFGGVKDSGYGTEGGTFAIRNFLNEKMIARQVG